MARRLNEATAQVSILPFEEARKLLFRESLSSILARKHAVLCGWVE